jgi:hypothetical protein
VSCTTKDGQDRCTPPWNFCFICCCSLNVECPSKVHVLKVWAQGCNTGWEYNLGEVGPYRRSLSHGGIAIDRNCQTAVFFFHLCFPIQGRSTLLCYELLPPCAALARNSKLQDPLILNWNLQNCEPNKLFLFIS